MKKKLTDLEFLKGNAKQIEVNLIELEKKYIESKKLIIEMNSYLREISQLPLQEYRKIQIRTLRNYLKKIENIHSANSKNILKSYEITQKILDSSLLDTLSKSVEDHIIKKIKKDYKLSLKSLKDKESYFFFKYDNTFYCIFAKLKKIYKFTNLDNLKKFIEKILNDAFLFPNLNSLNYFLLKNIKKFYVGEFLQDEKKIYIIFYNKILHKRAIPDLQLIKYSKSTFIPFYFYYKGRRIYFIKI